MIERGVWSVDRVAASNLLAHMGLPSTGEAVDQVASHLAQHRYSAYSWAAERVRESIIQRLASASMNLFHRKSDIWTEGFCNAEQMVMGISPEEALGLEPVRGRTKGQVLRAMVRKARAEQSQDEIRLTKER